MMAFSPVPPSRTVAACASADVRLLTVDEAAQGQRLDNFLLRHLKGVPKSLVYRIVRSGQVRVNKGRVQVSTRLQVGDRVRVPPVRVAAPSAQALRPVPAREFPVLFEDEVVLVINKPAGVAVHGGSGVSFGVIEQLRQARPQARFLELIHRLDKETSGALMIAKKRMALTALQEQLRQRQTGKTYMALVVGQWPQQVKTIDRALHKYLTADGQRRVRVVAADDALGRRAISVVRVAQTYATCTLLEVTIKTGRTHQIRVHLASQGCPILGDEKYGDAVRDQTVWPAGGQALAWGGRMFLHAQSLRVTHPVSGQVLQFTAPLPAECQALLRALGSVARA